MNTTDKRRPVLDLATALVAISEPDSWTEQKAAFAMYLASLQITSKDDAYESIRETLRNIGDLVAIALQDEQYKPLDDSLKRLPRAPKQAA